jgi:hypothetical protein
MRGAGPPQGDRPPGGAARSAVRGEHTRAAGPPQGDRPFGGNGASAVRGRHTATLLADAGVSPTDALSADHQPVSNQPPSAADRLAILAIVFMLVLLGIGSVDILSSVRAYVGGELWSKAQKNAALYGAGYAFGRPPPIRSHRSSAGRSCRAKSSRSPSPTLRLHGKALSLAITPTTFRA